MKIIFVNGDPRKYLAEQAAKAYDTDLLNICPGLDPADCRPTAEKHTVRVDITGRASGDRLLEKANEIVKCHQQRQLLRSEMEFSEEVFKELLRTGLATPTPEQQAEIDRENEALALKTWASWGLNQDMARYEDANAFYPCGCPKGARGEAKVKDLIERSIPAPYCGKDYKDKEAFRTARERFAKEMPYMGQGLPKQDPTLLPSADAEAYRWAKQICDGLGIKS